MDNNHKIGFDLYYGSEPVKELQITHKVFSAAVGSYEYVTDNSGKYSYCLSQIENEDFSTRFKIVVNYGFDPEYYEKMNKDKKFDPVNLELHKLNDMLSLTLNEADFQKHKELEYHSQTEKMESAVLWWPMLQVFELLFYSIIVMDFLMLLIDRNPSYHWSCSS